MSVLYLSDLGPGTKTFLLAEYMATDDALEQLTIWPGALQSNPKEQYRSKVNLMSYIAQHRTSLNPKKVDLFEEINFYSDITSEFLEWLVENIKGSGFGSTWKTLVAYQKITRCKEDIGVERAYGAMFYTNGHFPKWVDFEFYNYQVHDFKYNYKTAVFYSDIVVPLLREEVKNLKSTGKFCPKNHIITSGRSEQTLATKIILHPLEQSDWSLHWLQLHLSRLDALLL